ncbi:MAG: 23S rRNA (uracil(1939)-C(5))-methyltransferase RlmD, partial [Oscillospiraceae bacterium]|nr:23S rRNA (uracil(1939)-C(5))-methyltransferase RlmD [Oscillospiraceae bacterium]
HYEGMAVFVGNTAVGDVIEAHIILTKKTYAVGIIKRIITPSRGRAKPDCPVFLRCGGCAFRHISYDEQLKIKEQRVIDAFSRIGHFNIDNINLEPIIPAGNIYRYRNKAQYPVRKGQNGPEIGLFAEKSHRVANCRDCLLQPAEFAGILSIFEDWIIKNGVSLYDEATNAGLLRHICIRKGFATGEIMVTAVINGKRLDDGGALVSALAKMPQIKSVAVNINTGDTNVVLGDKYYILYGKGHIEDIIRGVRVRLSPLSFYQVNLCEAEKLYAKAEEYAAFGGGETLLDLYCGAGTVGLSMAKRAKKVIGVEIVPEAAENARANAEINGIGSAEFICADAGAAAQQLCGRGMRPDIIIIDPPRKGASIECIEAIINMAPEKLVYISCDPATLARDCKLLGEKGYNVRAAAPVDMFPFTAHVECVALLSKN